MILTKNSLVEHNWDTMKDNIQNHIGGLNFNYRVQLRDKKVEYINGFGEFIDRHKLLVIEQILLLLKLLLCRQMS